MSLYKQPNSTYWWVNIQVHGHPRVRRSTGTDDRIQAQRIHDEIKASLWQQPRLKGHTWGQAVMAWVNVQPRSESELLSLAKFGRHFADCLLTDVTRERVHKALNAFCETPGTYTRYRTMIAAILNLAKENGSIREVPKLAERKDKTQKTREWITREQWKKLHAELPSHLQPAALFAISTGLRQANVLGMRWARVDLDRRLVWVEGSEAKNGKAITVPLNQDAVAALLTVQGQHPEFCFTFRGKPFKEIKTAFIAACVRAGLGSYTTMARSQSRGVHYSGFTWHGLRHTWATWHIQAGTPVEVLQKLGAWSDLRMVLNYSHLTPGHLASFSKNSSIDL